jgi:hypothetical protein
MGLSVNHRHQLEEPPQRLQQRHPIREAASCCLFWRLAQQALVAELAQGWVAVAVCKPDAAVVVAVQEAACKPALVQALEQALPSVWRLHDAVPLS